MQQSTGAGALTAAPEPPRRLTWRDQFAAKYHLLVPVVFVLEMAVLATLSPVFLTERNVINVLQQLFLLAIVSFGATFVIVGGGFDLSSGSVVALSGTVMAAVMRQSGPAEGLIAGLLVGAFCGLINGVLVSRLQISPFIATLGMLVTARGLALAIAEGSVINISQDMKWLGTASLFGFLPVPVLVAFVVLLVGAAILHLTGFGLKVFAVGGNREAARLAGIQVGRVLTATYVLSGLCAGIAGVVLAARLSSGQPTAGNLLELFATAAVVLGGAALHGGEGNMFRTLIGVLFIGFLENGLNLLNVPYYWQQAAIGTVFIAVASSEYLRRR